MNRRTFRKLAGRTPSVSSNCAKLWAILLVVCSGGGCTNRVNTAADFEGGSTAPGESHVVVRVQKVENRSITTTVTALGHCEALPDKLAMITSAVEGQVTKLLAEEGQVVQAGQPLVQLDDTLARTDLEEKRSNRDSLVASLKLLQSLPRPEEQAASELAIKQAQVAVKQAEALVNRIRPLREKGEIAEQQLFDAEQALHNSRIQAELAQAQFDQLMLPPREEAVAEAKAKIAVAEKAIQTAEARLALFILHSPITGTLSSLTCHPGQTIAIGTPVGEIVDRRTVLVRVWLPTREAQLVHAGQTASIYTTSPKSAGQVLSADENCQGQVIFVGGVADAQTGNIPVSIQVENKKEKLLIGETLDAEIAVDKGNESLAVPQAAVHDEGEGPVITLVREGKAVILSPQLGADDKGWIAVREATLKPGEEVIVEGAYNLPEGTPVRIRGDSEHE